MASIQNPIVALGDFNAQVFPNSDSGAPSNQTNLNNDGSIRSVSFGLVEHKYMSLIV
jgi:hypothetical protein